MPQYALPILLKKKPCSRAGNQQDEKKNDTEYDKTHLDPDQNSVKVSCAENERPNYPDQPRHRAGGVGRKKYAKTIPNPARKKKQQHTEQKKNPIRKLGKHQKVYDNPPKSRKTTRPKKIEGSREPEISYPRLRLEINRRCAGPLVQTR